MAKGVYVPVPLDIFPILVGERFLSLSIPKLLGMWMAGLYLLFSLAITRPMGPSAFGAPLTKSAGEVIYDQLCAGNSCGRV
jgi:hypothetical protein